MPSRSAMACLENQDTAAEVRDGRAGEADGFAVPFSVLQKSALGLASCLR